MSTARGKAMFESTIPNDKGELPSKHCVRGSDAGKGEEDQRLWRKWADDV